MSFSIVVFISLQIWRPLQTRSRSVGGDRARPFLSDRSPHITLVYSLVINQVILHKCIIYWSITSEYSTPMLSDWTRKENNNGNIVSLNHFCAQSEWWFNAWFNSVILRRLQVLQTAIQTFVTVVAPWIRQICWLLHAHALLQ